MKNSTSPSPTPQRCFFIRSPWTRPTYLSGEVTAGLELLQEGRHEDGGEEEDDAPEEHVWDEGAVGAAGAPFEVSVQHFALLLAPEDTPPPGDESNEWQWSRNGDDDANKND